MERQAQQNGGYAQTVQGRYEDGEADPEAELIETKPELPKGLQEYIPADTWDGLEHMGHKTVVNKKKKEIFEGHWADLPPTPEDTYEA